MMFMMNVNGITIKRLDAQVGDPRGDFYVMIFEAAVDDLEVPVVRAWLVKFDLVSWSRLRELVSAVAVAESVDLSQYKAPVVKRLDNIPDRWLEFGQDSYHYVYPNRLPDPFTVRLDAYQLSGGRVCGALYMHLLNEAPELMQIGSLLPL